MSGKVSEVPGDHGPAWIEGPATALNWLTILPVRGATAFDRITGQRVVASLPFIGFIFGSWAALLGWALHATGLPSLLVAVLVIISCEVINRCMHLDGLSDVFDALGSYSPPKKAQEIIADPATGLMGMTAAFFSLTLRIVSLQLILDAQQYWLLIPGAVAGRIIALSAVHTSRYPMRSTGFGPMQVGTVPTRWILRWQAAAAIVFLPLLWLTSWSYALGYVVIMLLAGALMWTYISHWQRRFAGLNGDTTGAAVHLSTTLCMLLGACWVVWF
ncbi:MAG: adenosylcobinamide-GDP ribazoletransferase [Corynebacterium sp.]|nr:adenosylcobinamide-GDP ribazoletransferase [Corynebacterium sp.]